MPTDGTAFISVRDHDKARILPAARQLAELGFKIIATGGTQRYLAEKGVPAQRVNKVLEGRPHIVDAMTNGEVQLVFNTTEGQSRPVRLKVNPPGRADGQDSVLHHAARSHRRGRGNRRRQAGRSRGQTAAGLFQVDRSEISLMIINIKQVLQDGIVLRIFT